jgi:hypothetical protein
MASLLKRHIGHYFQRSTSVMYLFFVDKSVKLGLRVEPLPRAWKRFLTSPSIAFEQKPITQPQRIYLYIGEKGTNHDYDLEAFKDRKQAQIP